MYRVTIDTCNRDNKVTETIRTASVIGTRTINQGNRPQDIVFARNVVRALIDDLRYDLINVEGTCIATEQEKPFVPSDYIKFSPKGYWYA